MRRGGPDQQDPGTSNPDFDSADETSVRDSASDPADSERTDETEDGVVRRTTEKKGRPTPKRRESESRRGPVGPAPMTAREARARRRTNKDGTKKSRADRKSATAERRASTADRRERMMAGEEKFLPSRDRGPERRYVRNLVDSRRHLVGLFMPLALVMILSLFLNPQIQALISLIMLVMVVVMLIEGFFLSRQIYSNVHKRYPNVVDSRFSLGWYAFVRASQLRRMRTPRPDVSVGEEV